MSIQKIKSKLSELRDQKIPLAADIEGFCGNVTCISFAPSPDVAYVIPFAHADGTSVWTEDEEVELWQAVKELLEDPEVPKIGQNFLFDTFALAWTYGICTRNIYHDTMLGMFECFAELQKGLATQASLLTKEPFYKPDKTEEGELKFDSDEEFWRYNGLDSCVTYECYLKQMELLDEGQKAHLRFNVELLPALLFMQVRGMKWASDEASLARQEALRKAFELQARIDEEAMYGQGGEYDLLRMVTDELCEKNLVHLVSSQLCQKNIKRLVEVVEERWQPMKWNGKKWVKDGKLQTVCNASVPAAQARADAPSPWVSTAWWQPKHKTVTKNQPFTPLTLPECEEFILDSKQSEWQRTKEIWEELKNENQTRSSERPAQESSAAQFEGQERVPELHSLLRPNASLLGELSIPLSQENQTKEVTYAKNQSGENQRSICGDAAVEAGRLSHDTSESHEIESAESGSSGSGARPAQDTESGRSSSSALLGELSTILGLSINVGSTQSDGDAQRFLYEICGFKEQFKKAKGKKTDKVSSDQNALVKLYGDTRDVRVLWVLQLRRLRKLASDLALEVDDDGRLRSTFSLVKETGRMSASKSPTGKGTNAQALNKDLRYLVKADEGCQLRQRDLEGADSWTVACECAALGDETMLLDLKAGLKPAQALCVMFDKPEAASWSREELRAYFKLHEKRFKVWHYPAFKAVVHGSSYLMGIKTMIQTVLKNSMADLPLELSEAQPMLLDHPSAEAFQRLFFRRYAGISKWHKKASENLVRDGSIQTSAGHIRRFYGRKKEFKNGQWVANHDTLKEYLASAPQFWTTWATKKALWRLWYDEDNNLSGNGRHDSPKTLRTEPLFCVHDSLVYQSREEDAAWAEAKEKEWFNNPVEVAGITVVIPSEGQVGKDWSMK